MRIKKYAAAFLTATTVIGSLAACGKDDPKADPTPGANTPAANTPAANTPAATSAPKATPFPDRDLGGFEIIIGDHWSPEERAAATSAQQEATYAYQDAMMAKYNYHIQSKSVSSWDDMTATCNDSIASGTPAAQVFELDYRFVAKPMSNGYFYDLAKLSSDLDFSEDKWSVAVKNLMTKGSSIYGMRAQVSEPRGGVVFNKRLFQEAGLDPELPYNMQKDGTWTWSEFDKLCAKLTRDTNGDGVTDIYATVSQGGETIACLVASTGQDYFGVDADGKIYNNCKNADVLKAINFAVDLYNKGYEMPQPADSQWDYFFALFQEGKAAMTFMEEYACQPGQTYGDAMADEVGFVMPPKPDGAADYHSYVCDNISIIPSCYDAETASKIAFGYNVYTGPVEGYDDPDLWLDTYYSHFNDSRAVDETIARFNDGKSTHFLAQTLVAGVEVGDLVWQYPFQNQTPADRIDEIWDAWQTLIDECNN